MAPPLIRWCALAGALLACLGAADVTLRRPSAPGFLPLQGRLHVGPRAACIITDAGLLHCWGSVVYPRPVNTFYDIAAVAPSGVFDGVGQRFVGVGDYGACATDTSNITRCWDGPPGWFSIGGRSDVVAIAKGADPFGCGLTASGAALCWGSWAPGSGPTSNQVSIYAGCFYACSLSAARVPACWGGRYGEGAVPAAVTAAADTVALAINWGTTCALSASGNVTCWAGDLCPAGVGQPPAGVQGNAVHVSAKTCGGCAITRDARLVCWGTSHVNNSFVPNDEDTQDGFAAVSSWGGHTCAVPIRTMGVKCWRESSLPLMPYDVPPVPPAVTAGILNASVAAAIEFVGAAANVSVTPSSSATGTVTPTLMPSPSLTPIPSSEPGCALGACASTPALSCADVFNTHRAALNGTFWVQPVGAPRAYRAACWGDGWELALRADGRTATFGYDSPLWTNDELLNDNVTDGATDAKLAPFVYQPGNELLVRLSAPGGQRGGELRLAVPSAFTSLRALFAVGGYVVTAAPRAHWVALVPGGATLEANCNAQGINVQVGNAPPTSFPLRHRIGFVANNEGDCNTPDAAIGVGAGIAVNWCGVFDPFASTGQFVLSCVLANEPWLFVNVGSQFPGTTALLAEVFVRGPAPTPTLTRTPTHTPSSTASFTLASVTLTPTGSVSASVPASASVTASVPASASMTLSASASASWTASATLNSLTASASLGSSTASESRSSTGTMTPTSNSTFSQTKTGSQSPTPTSAPCVVNNLTLAHGTSGDVSSWSSNDSPVLRTCYGGPVGIVRLDLGATTVLGGSLEFFPGFDYFFIGPGCPSNTSVDCFTGGDYYRWCFVDGKECYSVRRFMNVGMRFVYIVTLSRSSFSSTGIGVSWRYNEPRSMASTPSTTKTRSSTPTAVSLTSTPSATASSTPTPTAMASLGTCLPGWVSVGDSHCYRAFPFDELTWAEGDAFCRAQAGSVNASLASVRNAVEADFVVASSCGGSVTNLWTGATDSASEAGSNRSCCWGWSSGAAPDFFLSPAGQALWGTNQPDDSWLDGWLPTAATEPHDCVEVVAHDRTLNDLWCEERRGVCCEALRVALATALPSPTQTPTGTPSRSESQTGTSSPSATPTASAVGCAPPVQVPASFAETSIIVLRVGLGLAPVGSGLIARAGFLDEIDPSSGARIQTIALPTGPLQYDANSGVLLQAPCTFNAATARAGLLTRALDGRSLTLACLAQAPNTLISATGDKAIMSVLPSGAVVPVAVMTSYVDAVGSVVAGGLSTGIYGAVTDDGSNFWFSTGGGVLWMPRGRVGSAHMASTTPSTGLIFHGGDSFVYRVSTSGNVGVLGSATLSGTPPGIFTNHLELPGGSTSTNPSGMWMTPDGLQLYVLQLWNTAQNPQLYKLTRTTAALSSRWFLAPGYPIRNTTLTNARGLAGGPDVSGQPSLWITAATGLVRFFTSNLTFIVVSQPCAPDASMRWAGVAAAPWNRSPSTTATGSGTSTASPTVTPSSSATPSASLTSTQTGTSSPSCTGSQTVTPSHSATRTCTPSASGTRTATSSVSATRSGTASASGTRTVTGTGSGSQTGTGSASETRSGTGSPSGTRTASGTLSGSQTGTSSASGTRTVTGTGSGSQTGTGSASRTPTVSGTSSGSSASTVTASGTRSRTGTASGTRTPPSTRTATPTPPICRGLANVRPLAGFTGSTPLRSTDASGTPGMYTAGSCATGFKTFYPGARLVYAWSLNETAVLGGTLRLSTCGVTADNTVLYVGTGCPSWATPFGCLAGNDDAAPACDSNGLASTLTLTVTQRSYFIQVGGANGRNVTAGLQWVYSAPAPVASRTGSATRTRSSTRTRSASGTRTRSRTRKAK